MYTGPQDIIEHNLKLILGLVWSLILRYQIAQASAIIQDEDGGEQHDTKAAPKTSAKKLLMGWTNAMLARLAASNFTTDWNDGVRLSALVDHCQPGLIPDYASLDPHNALQNIENAMSLAEKHLNIPRVLQSEDLAVPKPDELSVMTYISYFCQPDSAGLNLLKDWINQRIPKPVSNFSTDWVDGCALGALTDAVSGGDFSEYESMNPQDIVSNCQNAMDAAERILRIEKSVTPTEFASPDLDQLLRVTYLTHFMHATPSRSPASGLTITGPGVSGSFSGSATHFVLKGRVPLGVSVEVNVSSPSGSKVPVHHGLGTSSGSYAYTPAASGLYVVEVMVGGDHVHGSPAKVTHLPPPNPSACSMDGRGLRASRVGQPAHVLVNCESGGTGELRVNVVGPSGPVHADVQVPKDKNYVATFTPVEVGPHVITVLWSNTDVPGSPYKCNVTDPRGCLAHGTGLGTTVVVGQPQEFRVVTERAGEGILTSEVLGTNGTSIPVTATEERPGHYTCTYTLKEPGTCLIHVWWSEAPIAGSPFSVHGVVPPNASNCKASGLPTGRLQVGKMYDFTVDATSAGSGELFVAHTYKGLSTKEKCEMSVTSPGMYLVSFVPRNVGVLHLEPTYSDAPIMGAPFDFKVNDPSKCAVNVAEISKNRFFSKRPITFECSTQQAGEGDLTATIAKDQGAAEDMAVTRGPGGAYHCHYQPKSEGQYTINVFFDKIQIPNMPLHVLVLAGSPADMIVVTPPTPRHFGAFIVGQPYDYIINTSKAGVAKVMATGQGKHTGSVPALCVVGEPSNAVEYKVTMEATRPDQYVVNIRWGEEDVPGSPFLIKVEDRPCADSVVVEGPHYLLGSSEPVRLAINAEKAGAGELKVTCHGEKAGAVPVDVQQLHPKTFQASFGAKEPDVYTIKVLWADFAIPGSPFIVDTTPPDASKCIVIGPTVPLETSKPVELVVDATSAGNGKLVAEAVGVSTMAIAAVDIKETATKKYTVLLHTVTPDIYTFSVNWGHKAVQGSPFMLNLHPPNASAVTIAQPPTQTVEAGQHIAIVFNTSKAGRGHLTASCVGLKVGEIPAKITEKPQLLWEVKFAPPQPDIYTLAIKWADHHIRGSPFTINLMPVDITKVKAIGPTMPKGLGGPVELMVITRDAGKGKVTCTAHGPTVGPVAVSISETGQDTYQLTFTPPKPDVYSMEVQFGGQSVRGSPFRIKTLPGDGSKVLVVQSTKVLELSKPIAFSCDTSQAGAGTMTASCRGEKHGSILVDITEVDIDHHTISFTPYSPDRYSIKVEWSGAEVKGSPFRVNLLPVVPEKVKVGELHIPEEAVGSGGEAYVYLDLDFSEAGPGVPSGWVEGDKTARAQAIVQEVGTYTSRVKFQPKQSDMYHFNVLFAERPVKGSPFTVNLLPSDPTKVEVVERLVPAEGVGPVSLVLDTTNAGKGVLTARASGDAVGLVPSQLDQVTPGVYKVKFNPSKPDVYKVDVYWAGSPIKSSPFVINLLPPCYPEKVECSQPVVIAIGKPVTTMIDVSKAGKGTTTVKCQGRRLEPVDVELQTGSQPDTYLAVFVPKEEGIYELRVFFDGKEVPGSPLQITLVQPVYVQFMNPLAELVEASSSLEASPHPTITSYVGDPVNIIVRAGEHSGPLEASAVGDMSGSIDVKVSRDGEGMFGIDFNPSVADRYTVAIKLHGEHVPRSPFVVNYLWKNDASKCVLVGLEECPPRPSVKQELKFGVDVTRAGDGELLASSDGPSQAGNTSKLQVLPGDKQGFYHVTYIPTASGQHRVHLTWSGVPIPNSPVEFSVGELRAFPFGKPVNIDINIAAKGSDLEAHCINEDNEGKLKVKISKVSKDQFKFNFNPKDPGVHAIHIVLKGNEITGSPFRIKVGPRPNPSGVKVLRLPELAYLNEPMSFVVDVSEAGGGSLSLKAAGPKGENDSTLTVKSTLDHLYTVTYTPQTVGDHTFLVSWAEEPVPCGPLVVPVKAKLGCHLMDEDADIFNKVWLFKPNVVVRFKISTADAGKGKLNITSRGPAKADVKILDNNNGTFTCEFTPSAPGKYNIDVLWNEQPIIGSPFTLTFKSNANAVVAGLNLESESFRVGVSHRFKLHCDSIGQGVLELQCKPVTGGKVMVTPIPGKNSYHCEIVPLITGPHELFVLFNGNHIMGSPFKVNFDNCGDASKCRMVSSSTEQQHEVGDAVSFIISTEGAGKGKLIAQVENPTTKEVTPVNVVPSEVDPNSFSLQFVPGMAAEYLLTVKYDGQHIVGSPFKLVFAEPQSAAQCRAEGEGLAVANVDKPNKFIVHTVNVRPEELDVIISGDEDVKGPNKTKLDDTTYEIYYSPSKPGMLNISVTWGGEHIPGSPFSVRSYQPTDPTVFSIVNPPSEAFTGLETKFKVTAKEGMHEGILGVSVQPASGEAMNGNTASLGGAEYECILPTLDLGKYEVSVRWNGGHIVGSPFSLKVVKRPMPEKIKVYGPGLTNGCVGQEGNFTVETAEGGPGTLAVRLHGPRGAFKINMRRHPNNDRTILVRYDPTIEGVYRVDVTWSDIHVPGSPFTVNVDKQNSSSSTHQW